MHPAIAVKDGGSALPLTCTLLAAIRRRMGSRKYSAGLYRHVYEACIYHRAPCEKCLLIIATATYGNL